MLSYYVVLQCFEPYSDILDRIKSLPEVVIVRDKAKIMVIVPADYSKELNKTNCKTLAENYVRFVYESLDEFLGQIEKKAVQFTSRPYVYFVGNRVYVYLVEDDAYRFAELSEKDHGL